METLGISDDSPPQSRFVIAKGDKQLQGRIEQHRLILGDIEAIIRPQAWEGPHAFLFVRGTGGANEIAHPFTRMEIDSYLAQLP